MASQNLSGLEIFDDTSCRLFSVTDSRANDPELYPDVSEVARHYPDPYPLKPAADHPLIIVAGSRGFTDPLVFTRYLDTYLAQFNAYEFISGCASGPDSMAIEYARRRYGEGRCRGCQRYPADWQLYGSRAGYIRNAEMAEIATHLVAFWDGRSKGTKHMIETARKKGLCVLVILVDTDTE